MSTLEQNYLLRLREALPTDIALGLGAAGLSTVIALLVQTRVVLTTVAALPLLLFVPGYFVLGALFPRGAHAPQATRTRIDTVERLALSYAVSLAVVPLVALGLTLLSLAITVETVLLGVALVVVGCTPLVVVRRRAVPEQERYQMAGLALFARLRAALGRDLLVNGLLTVAVTAGLLVTMGVIVAPPQDSGYTELAVLTENGEGELVADGYDAAVGPNGSGPVVLSVANHYDEPTTYSVVVQAQRVDDDTVRQRERLHKFEQEVRSNETWQEPHRVSTSMAGDNVRVVYLVYEGHPPDEPGQANADRSVFFWTGSAENAG
jgi:uncharacterized membrane protein